MARYAVEIEKIYKKTVIVEDAETFEDAMDQVQEALQSGVVIIGYVDHYATHVKPQDFFSVEPIPDGEEIFDWYDHI